jgi:hypothetical protein
MSTKAIFREGELRRPMKGLRSDSAGNPVRTRKHPVRRVKEAQLEQLRKGARMEESPSSAGFVDSANEDDPFVRSIMEDLEPSPSGTLPKTSKAERFVTEVMPHVVKIYIGGQVYLASMEQTLRTLGILGKNLIVDTVNCTKVVVRTTKEIFEP